MRKIIHVDMDAFYASIEQRDHPEWRGLPLVVGYDGPRGVVSTASYEARRFGIHSAMSMSMAKQMCPHLLIAPHRMEAYSEVSHQIHKIFFEFTDLVESVSIDEAFLDVTKSKQNLEEAEEIAMTIKRKIFEATGLTASAGISYNKFLAKIASDVHKPNGIFVVNSDQVNDFVGQLQVEKFWGIGPKTADRMHKMGIFTGEQLRKVSEKHLVEVFGKMGTVYSHYAQGIDDRPVVNEWIRKSVSCEHTFLEDIQSSSSLIIELYHIVMDLVERIKNSQFEGKTLTLKVKFFDFSQITRSVTVSFHLKRKEQILPLAKQMLKEVDYHNRPIRLLGLCVSKPSIERRKDMANNWEEGWLEGFEKGCNG